MQEKQTSGFLTRSDTKRPVQPLSYGENVWYVKEEGLYKPSSEAHFFSHRQKSSFLMMRLTYCFLSKSENK